MRKSTLFTDIEQVINSLDIAKIHQDRTEILQHLIDYIQSKVDLKETVRINFICTHNSRRSHLSQVWAQTMATYFGIETMRPASARPNTPACRYSPRRVAARGQVRKG